MLYDTNLLKISIISTHEGLSPVDKALTRFNRSSLQNATFSIFMENETPVLTPIPI